VFAPFVSAPEVAAAEVFAPFVSAPEVAAAEVFAPMVETGAFDMGLFTAADVGLAPTVESTAAAMSLSEVARVAQTVKAAVSPLLAIGRALRGAVGGAAAGRDPFAPAGAWPDTPADDLADSLWTAGAFAGVFLILKLARG
jgi:hypothetical protein